MNRRPAARPLSAAACLIAVAALSACSAMVPDKHRSLGYSVHEPVTRLVVKGSTGDVRVIGGGSSVDVTERQNYRGSEPRSTHKAVGGTLTLTYNCDDCGISYEVHVPAGTVVSVSAATGNVTLTGLGGAVEASTDTGDVTATGLSCPHARLTTDTGDVRADFGTAPASLYATAQTGSIGVTVPQGTAYAVHAEAQTGDVRVGVPTSDGAPHAITATAQTGDVSVRTA